jgi:predicted flap endonuclease-1-like 5' DNA nuclease
VAAGAEVIALRARVADLEPKFRAASEENGKLRSQVSEVAPKLAMAAAAGAEVIALKTQLAQLEPQVADLQQEIQASAAELTQCRGRVAELEQQATPKVERDDLKKIYGIGPVLEKRLNGLGVYFFREIAMWTKEDVLRYEEHLKEFPDRIERDNWVEGAREQHFKKYGETLLKEKSAGA